MSEPVRVRFAPSPTGYLHVGGARSALFNFLFARHHNGTFILRIEDTDQSRYVADALKEIYESLRWLGMQWDEGPEAGGDSGPYVQSQRLDLYASHARILLDKGHAYRCFCTPERIAAVRAEQEKNKQPLGYDRHCRDLPEAQVGELLDKNTPHVIRLKIPAGRTVVFDDAIRGRIEYQSAVLDDLVLLKTDGFPTYHMANVVDDHLMKITHVLRGDEWIASTPRHVLLYEAFGWSPPIFAHLPVILSADGGKLSKRKGAASVMDYKQAGFLPEALFNFLALLGWAPGEDREKMTLAQMIETFSLDQVSPKASVLDEKKLEWMNGLYLAERETESLLPELIAAWRRRGWLTDDDNAHRAYARAVTGLLKNRSKKLTEIEENAVYFFNDPAQYEEKAAKKYFTGESIPILEKLVARLSEAQSFDCHTLEEIYRAYSGEMQVGAGILIHPTRLAISGVSVGPGLFELMEVLGKDTVVRRMRKAMEFLQTGNREA